MFLLKTDNNLKYRKFLGQCTRLLS